MPSTLYWLGTATSVAQVSSVTFGTYDTGTTRTITVGGVSLSAVDSGGTLATALTALAVVLNASTHLYFSTVTWSSDATKIIGTADVAGVPFTFSGSVSGGTGTVSGGGVMSTTTASKGPCDWSTATNWSTGAVPVTGDTVILRDSSNNIFYGLNQSAVTLAKLVAEKTFTGYVGLNRSVFAYTANGSTQSTAVEYKPQYCAIGATIANLGEFYGTGTASGSGRLMFDFGSAASTITVFDTAASAAETSKPSIRLLCNSASTELHCRLGTVGIGVDTPGETSVIGKIEVEDTSASSAVITGDGVTITTWEQQGGANVCKSSAALTTLNLFGGTLRTEGNFKVTTANINEGIWAANNVNSGDSIMVATLNLNGGQVDTSGSRVARTITTLNLGSGGREGQAEFLADASIITISNNVNDSSGPYKLTFESV